MFFLTFVGLSYWLYDLPVSCQVRLYMVLCQ